ncbi:deoxynucleotide monophosphate kinase family protein [Oerskovia enterophila]|uniref:Deoxynucleotide monophosphate kinase n=1 Tax=Oerskovia enterophila TaxID=43678 RepID=A0ABX2Y1A9_9CELL|nr:hypothetical protein [Oerskovia enterophila]OCI30275.1 hypothetical protein OERS_30130 [Oerskovia enterophila]
MNLAPDPTRPAVRARPVIGVGWLARAGKDSVASILVRDFGFSRYAFADQMKEALAGLDPFLDGTTTVSTAGGIDVASRGRTTGAEVERLRESLSTLVLPDWLGFPDVDAATVDAIITSLDPRLDGTSTLSDRIDADGWEGAKKHRVYASEVRGLMQRFGTDAIRGHLGDDVWVRALERALVQDESLGGVYPVVISDVRARVEAQWVHAQAGTVWEVRRPGIVAVNAHSSEFGLPSSMVDGVIENSGTLDDLAQTVATLVNATFGASPARAAA